MSGNSILTLGALMGSGVATLAVVLVALAVTAFLLQRGRAAEPAPVRERPVDPAEAALFARYGRGEIDAEQYHLALARLAERR